MGIFSFIKSVFNKSQKQKNNSSKVYTNTPKAHYSEDEIKYYLNKHKNKLNRDKNKQTKVSISIEISKNVMYEDLTLPDNVKIKVVDIKGYKSESGGYVNYSTFKVKGKNPETNRSKTIQVKAKDTIKATQIAQKKGLMEPFIITPIPNREATDNQVAYAHKLNAKFPNDICFDDIHCIIDRIVNKENYPANQGLVNWANDLDIQFSSFTNQQQLINSIRTQLTDHNLWIFYSYFIYCKINNMQLDDCRESCFYDKFVECGKMIEDRKDIQCSFLKNNKLTPYTKGYKEIKDWLTLNKVI